ncbi:hypothetical protein B0H63DRAFT_242058 [Podospora didyma]|uniref:Glycoside Hydrolase Family 61 n=1 Tax=Podospora didyma TaxID=330526 RepID=A0AAE0KK37_9PEZI|nr:hypothetical protein B0H63DRAFT_242058 [Podospora didyma]
MFFTKAVFAVGGLATLASAHIKMNTPKPFSSPQVSSSPIDRSGSNFPCQSADGVYSSAGVSNVMPLGSKQPLLFTGSAVHGGGSCQVSITYDTAPTKNSVWKVIHSIEGGCPAKNTPGNLPDNAEGATPFEYSFPIPSDIPTGNATIAWTWLNRIGNREFYMNCAPVTLTGTSGDQKNFEGLPNMVVANIPSISSCNTDKLDDFDYKYPNPGNSVENFSSFEMKPLNGDCGAAPAGGAGTGTGTGTGTGAGTGSGSPATSSPAASTPTRPGGVFVENPNGPAVTPPTAQPSAQPVAQPSAQPAAPPAAQPSAQPASGAGSGTAFPAGTACTPEGQWNCIGGTSFQRCASGIWSAPQAVAAGTACTPGTGEIKFAAAKERRHPRAFWM